MIIGISGRIGSGKDTVGKIIQYLEAESNKGWTPEFTLQEFLNGRDIYNMNYVKDYTESISEDSGWQIKKFASKIKQIVSILTGIPVDDLEKQEVKNRALGREWCYKTKPPSYNEQFVEMTVRELLQKIGTEAMREVIHPNIWVNALFADYKPRYNSVAGEIPGKDIVYPNWIITDVRFSNEVEAIKQRGGVLWRVNRGKTLPCSAHALHPSETALDNYKEFNEVIENNGSIEELTQKIKTAFHKLKQTK